MNTHEELILEGLRVYNMFIRDQIPFKEVDLYLHKLSRSCAPKCHKIAYRNMIMNHRPDLTCQLELDLKPAVKPLNELEKKLTELDQDV